MQRGHTKVNPMGAARLAFAVVLLLCLPTLHVSGQSIVISELMYHPVDGTNPVDGDLYEFVELFNAGPSSYDLKDAEFTAGISYTFSSSLVLPPSGYVVVIRDLGAFTNRYPSVTNIAPGIYSGKLANGGEQLTLKDI